MKINEQKIAIIGLGYVGLPLAVEFAKKTNVVGFDINENRINELRLGIDRTKEIDEFTLNDATIKNNLYLTSEKNSISSCNVFIVTVPTPTDQNNRPVLTPLIKASETIGQVLKKGDVVIYESTVYPGVTEDVCVPVLIEISGKEYNSDFFVGYSPERINPGDKEHTVSKILKVTSGSSPETAQFVDDLYKSIIIAGTHKASSIKVAEAAKVIENSQRDINIAFVNELAKIFNLLGIDTSEVLDAAATKWNFLKFNPGLVGGHCIGVDPYYLAQKAQEVGYHPEIILAGRRLNDGMGQYVASEVIKLMILKNITFKESKILILGFTFKENCPDIRNTRVIDIFQELKNYGLDLYVYDPIARNEEIEIEFGIKTISEDQLKTKSFSCAVLAVAHEEFLNLEFQDILLENSVLYDVKGVLPKNKIDGRL